MAFASRSISSSLMLLAVLSLLALFTGSASSANLSPYFYHHSCPQLPYIVKSVVHSAVAKERRMGASLLRLHFHDCFVNGCDASLLLDDTPTFQGEKESFINKNSTRGFEFIDEIKLRLEQACPGVVSCADILAITARDAAHSLGGPYWDVKFGRRDSKTASLTAANAGIPSLNSSVHTMISRYQSLGLSTRNLVALNGAHTIGQARCVTFRSRVHGGDETSPIDAHFAAERRARCPAKTGSGDVILAPLDLQTPAVFDNLHYKNLMAKKGLLHIDQQLYGGGSAEADYYVRKYSEDNGAFMADFVEAFVKMGDIQPLTGHQGEIRSNCRAVNA